MNNTVLVGQKTGFLRMPRQDWERHLAAAPGSIASRLTFMSEAHHLVRNFAVTELPRPSTPLPPAEISHTLGIPLSKTLEILADLEKHLFFLVRSTDGDAAWAFPVTVDSTGHSLRFSPGERLDAA